MSRSTKLRCVDVARCADSGRALEGGNVHFRQIGGHADLSEAELLAFLDVEGHEIAVTFPREFRVHAGDTEVDIAARGVEILEKLLVELDAILDERVALNDRAQEAGLLGLDNPAQATIGILLVADKADALDLGDTALEHLEDKVDAVIGPANDARLNACGDPALLKIGFGDLVRVGLGGRGRIDPARLRLQKRREVLVVDAPVALDRNAVDRRILDDPDQERVALRDDLDALEKTRILDVLEGIVQLPVRQVHHARSRHSSESWTARSAGCLRSARC